MDEPDNARALGGWAWAALLLVGAIVLYGDIGWRMVPGGQDDVPLYAPGQNDFSLPFLGARALLAGENPYLTERPEYVSLFGPKPIEGTDYKQGYPPTHLLLYTPFAFFTGDWVKAARIWFQISLLAIVGLAVWTWLLLRRLVDPSQAPSAMLLFLVPCLVLNTGVRFGLERGQSDNVTACLVWLGVLLFVRRSYAAAMFLLVLATATKGYSVLLLGGLSLLGLTRATWRRVVAGGMLAAALFVLPVARYVIVGFRAASARSNFYYTAWFNHGFQNVVHTVAPNWAKRGRLLLAGIALAVTVLCWLAARRRLAANSPASNLWIVLFATSALGTMIGLSSFSVSYDLVLLLPGALVLAASQARLGVELQIPAPLRHALGLAFLVSTALLFQYRVDFSAQKTQVSGLPVSGFGLVLLLGTVGFVAIYRGRREHPATG